MAITTTDIKGTDSISASRITINDNVATMTAALNNVLSIVDIGTGRIDNTTYASLNDVKTKSITVTGSSGIDVQSGKVVVPAGVEFDGIVLGESSMGSSPVFTVTGASAFQVPTGATWSATGGAGSIVYVYGSGWYGYNGTTWEKLND